MGHYSAFGGRYITDAEENEMMAMRGRVEEGNRNELLAALKQINDKLDLLLDKGMKQIREEKICASES